MDAHKYSPLKCIGFHALCVHLRYHILQCQSSLRSVLWLIKFHYLGNQNLKFFFRFFKPIPIQLEQGKNVHHDNDDNDLKF